MATPPPSGDDVLSSLVCSLGASMSVSSRQENDPDQPHPRWGHYKANMSSHQRQEKRRRDLLKRQCERRDDFLAVARKIAECEVGQMEEDELDEGEEEMETDPALRSKEWRPLKMRQSHKNQVMLSEWWVDCPPADYPTEWLAVLVPMGQRCLVVAGHGRTRQFSRRGAFIREFPSALPGGYRGRIRSGQGDSVTLLDCVFAREGVFHVLDVMVWDSFSYYDCDTEFRFFYLLRQKIAEDVPDITFRSATNPFVFKPLKPFESQELCSRLISADLSEIAKLDGVLFYHRRVQYLPGRKLNPLVLWLKPYMLREMVPGVEDLPQSVKALAPAHYVDAVDFVAEYKEKDKRKKKAAKQKSKKKSDTFSDMEVERNKFEESFSSKEAPREDN